MPNRRRFTAEFKARVALEALRGDKTIQQIAAKHKLHPNQVSAWKRQAVDGLGEVFSNGANRACRDHESERPRPSRQDRRADGGTGFFSQRAQAMSRGERKAMIFTRRARAELEPSMPPAFDRPVLVLLCAQGGEPFESGADASDRRVVHEVPVLRQPPDGPPVAAGRRLRRPSPGSQVDAIDRPGGDLSGAENQRAASHAPDLSLSSQRDGYRPAQSALVRDITYIPEERGFLYLVAIMDWATRHVLSLAAVEHHGRWILRRGLGRPLARYGQPEIFNTDQGSQFTSLDFTGVLKTRASASPWTVESLHGQHLHRAPVAVSQV